MKSKLEEWEDKLNSADEFVRIEALDAPPLSFPDRVVSCILGKLADPSHLVRQAAAEVLGKFDNDEVRAALRRCVEEDDNYLVREYAISSLGMIAEHDDLRFLIGLAEDEGNPEIFIHICTGIFAAALKMLKNEMISIIGNSDPILKTSAINALVFSFASHDFSDIITVLENEMNTNSDTNIRTESEEAYLKFVRLQELFH